MIPKYHIASEIMGYGGGRLFVVKEDLVQLLEKTSIYQQNPGFLVVATVPSGPKEWSPIGLVPKDWTFLFKMPSSVVTILASWRTSKDAWDKFEFAFPRYENSSLYFAPKPPFWRWARETLDEKAQLHYWNKPYWDRVVGKWVSKHGESWVSLCGLSCKVPSYYGPWPTDSGVRCPECDAIFRHDQELEIR